MAQTKVWNVDIGTTVRRNRSTGATAGQGQSKRWYVGRHGSFDYDAFVKFIQDWTGVGRIVSAILTVYTGDGLGDTPSTTTDNPHFVIRRNTTAFVEGNAPDGTWQADDFTSPTQTPSNQRSPDLTREELGVNNIDVTTMVEDMAPGTVKKRSGAAGGKATNHGFAFLGRDDDKQNIDLVSDKWADTALRPIITLTYEPGLTAPEAPTGLAPSGSVASFADFQGDFADQRPTDTLRQSHVQVFDAGRACTATAADNVITDAGHGLRVGDRIFFSALSGGAPLSLFTQYFVVSVLSSSTFWISASNGGPVINITSNMTAGTWTKMIYDGTKNASTTEIEADRFAHTPDNLHMIPNTTYRWRARVYDNEGQVSSFTSLVSFSFQNQAPDAPSSLSPNIQTYTTLDGVKFSAVFSDPDPGDYLLAHQFQLSAYPEGDAHWNDDESILWNTGKRYRQMPNTPMPTGGGAVVISRFSEVYGGNGLTAGTYYWRVRAFDNKHSASAWSYAQITVSESFEADPEEPSTRIQIRPRAPWRILIKEMKFNATGGNVTGVAATNVLTTATAHGLRVGRRVRFSSLTGGTGLLVDTDYWVKTVPTTKTFTLTTSDSGVDTIDFTTDITAGALTAVTTRGPGNVVAVLEDAKNVGASELYNSPGEVHFTLPKTHPQISAVEPRQVHYAVEHRMGDGWHETFAGLMTDFDATDTDVVFYGIDYLGLLDFIADERYDPSNPDKPAETGGSKYVTTGKNSISYIVTDQLTRATQLANSPVGFITNGSIASMTETLTVYSTFAPVLQFIVGLLDSHRAGTGNRTRLRVRKTSAGGYEFVVQDNPGQQRDNLRMRYGELVQGYRVVAFGSDFATRIMGIGRAKDGIKVTYDQSTGQGIPEETWGRFTQVRLFDGVSDANDLKRRIRQSAMQAGKLGKQIGVGLRTLVLMPKDGYEICDTFPIDIEDGSVSTSRMGGGYWTVVGITWEVNALNGKQTTTLTFQPREDGIAPSSDLLSMEPISTQREWEIAYRPPATVSGIRLVGRGRNFLDQNTGVVYERGAPTVIVAGVTGTR